MKKLMTCVFITILALSTTGPLAAAEPGTPIASTKYVQGAVTAANEYTDSKYGKIPTSANGTASTGQALIWVE